MRTHIEKMTSTDAENPEVFGLHKNADITYRTLQAESMINTIIDTQPKQVGRPVKKGYAHTIGEL